jgi:hypothetical protein
MKSVEFCYWLQGLFELGDTTGGISSEKTDLIKRHLAMVFHHEIDPSYGQQQVQDALNKLHQTGLLPDTPATMSGQFGGSKDGLIFRC